MNNTYPFIASVASGLRLGCGAPSPWLGVLFFSLLNNVVIGHSMSKGIKKRQPSLHRLLLPVAFNYFN